MLDPNQIPDRNDERIAAILAIAELAADYQQGFGRKAIRGVLPGISDAGADALLDTVHEHLAYAQDAWEEQPNTGVAEMLRDEWIDHAQSVAMAAIRANTEQQAAA